MVEKNNFFNLESDSDEEEVIEEDNRTNNDEIKKKINKWDWDREENYKLYYQINNKITTNSLKRSNDNDELATASSSGNSKKKQYTELVEQVRIEKINDNTNKLKFNLFGHKSTINRINWTRKSGEHLLSSSFDK